MYAANKKSGVTERASHQDSEGKPYRVWKSEDFTFRGIWNQSSAVSCIRPTWECIVGFCICISDLQ